MEGHFGAFTYKVSRPPPWRTDPGRGPLPGAGRLPCPRSAARRAAAECRVPAASGCFIIVSLFAQQAEMTFLSHPWPQPPLDPLLGKGAEIARPRDREPLRRGFRARCHALGTRAASPARPGAGPFQDANVEDWPHACLERGTTGSHPGRDKPCISPDKVGAYHRN